MTLEGVRLNGLAEKMQSKYIFWIVVALLGGVLLFGVLTPSKGTVTNIDNSKLVALQADGAALVDVRTPSEFAGAHLPGAVNVSMDQIAQASQSWDRNAPLVLYCATGARSANAAALLSAQGFKTLYNLERGIVAWDGAVETGDGSSAEGLTVPKKVETNGKPIFIDFASST